MNIENILSTRVAPRPVRSKWLSASLLSLMTGVLFGALALTIPTASKAQSADLIAKAIKEGKVMIYGEMITPTMREIKDMLCAGGRLQRMHHVILGIQMNQLQIANVASENVELLVGG